MSKNILYALIIMAIAVVVLIFNKGDVDVNLLITKVTGLKSIVFLVFMGVGVSIGVLLK